MGDRGNIKVGKIYFYTHWGGSNIKYVLQKALKRKQRWGDEPYLARIIFCELVGIEDFEGEIGYGISTHINDNEHNILDVNVGQQTIKEITEKGDFIQEWTFLNFIKLEIKEII